MSAPITSAQDVVAKLRDAFELVEDRPGVSFIQFPVHWRGGDWLPVAVERTAAGWRLTDDTLHFDELGMRTRANFYSGRAGDRFQRALRAVDLRLEDGAIVRDVGPGEDWPAAYADFVRGLLAIEAVVDSIPAPRRVRPRQKAPTPGPASL